MDYWFAFFFQNTQDPDFVAGSDSDNSSCSMMYPVLSTPKSKIQALNQPMMSRIPQSRKAETELGLSTSPEKDLSTSPKPQLNASPEPTINAKKADTHKGEQHPYYHPANVYGINSFLRFFF